MTKSPRIKVAAPSFSRHEILMRELREKFSDVTANLSGETLAGDKLVDYLADADATIIGLERVDDALLQRLPRLKLIAKYGVGLDSLDLDACAKRGVAIGWTGGVNRLAVAEMTICFMLGMARNLFNSAIDIRAGRWVRNGGIQFVGATVGLIGVGFIGKEVVRLLKPFGCRILVNDILDQRAYYEREGVIAAAKDQIYAEADFVSLHVPLNNETRKMINDQTLAKMRPSTFLINTCRGEVVDQAALKRALQEKRIAGAAIDVYDKEPPTDADFLALPNLVGTPHIGGNSREAVLAMGRSSIAHLERFFATQGG